MTFPANAAKSLQEVQKLVLDGRAPSTTTRSSPVDTTTLTLVDTATLVVMAVISPSMTNYEDCRFGHICTSGCGNDFDCPCQADHCCAMTLDCEGGEHCDDHYEPKNPAAVALGTLGGKSKSEKKAAASRLNGLKGGRKKSGDSTPVPTQEVI